MSKQLELFISFFKIGLFTFGGGYAMIPLIQKEIAEQKKWITDDDILEIVAIAESTPGPIAVNAATFVGWRVAGFWGALCATIGVVLPSFVIISLIAFVLGEFQNVRAVRYAFFGIRAGVLALILRALVSMYKKSPKGALGYMITILAFAASVIFDINAIVIILLAGVTGLVSAAVMSKRAEKKL